MEITNELIDDIKKVLESELENKEAISTDELIKSLGKNKVPHPEFFRKKLRKIRKEGKIPGFKVLPRLGFVRDNQDGTNVSIPKPDPDILPQVQLSKDRIEIIKKFLFANATDGNFVTAQQINNHLPKNLQQDLDHIRKIIKTHPDLSSFQGFKRRGFTQRDKNAPSVESLTKEINKNKSLVLYKSELQEALEKIKMAQIQLLELHASIVTATSEPNFTHTKSISQIQIELSTIQSLIENTIQTSNKGRK